LVGEPLFYKRTKHVIIQRSHCGQEHNSNHLAKQRTLWLTLRKLSLGGRTELKRHFSGPRIWNDSHGTLLHAESHVVILHDRLSKDEELVAA